MGLLRDEPLNQKLLKQGFWVYLFSFLVAPAGYIFRVILSREFDVATVGVFFSVAGLVVFLATYNDLGLTNSLKYYLPTFWIKKKYDAVKTSFLMTLGFQIFTGILIIIVLLSGGIDRLATNHFHHPLAKDFLQIMLWYFLLVNIFQVLGTLMASFQDVIGEKLSYFIRMWSISIVAIALFAFGFDDPRLYAWSRVFGLAAGVIYTLFIFFYKYQRRINLGRFRFQSINIKSYARYALWIFIGMNAHILMSQIDQQMVVNMLGAYDAGLYSNYLSLFNAFGYMYVPLVSIVFPIVVELYTKKKEKDMNRLYNLIFNYMTLFTLIGSVFFFLLGPEVSVVLYGADFEYSGVLLKYAAFFLPMVAVNMMCSTILSAIGKVDSYVKIVLSVSVLNVILNYFMIDQWGMLGALFATMLSWSLIAFFAFSRVSKEFVFKPQRGFWSKNILLLFVCFTVFFFLLDYYSIVLFAGGTFSDFIVLGILFCVLFSLVAVCNMQKVRALYKEILFLRRNQHS